MFRRYVSSYTLLKFNQIVHYLVAAATATRIGAPRQIRSSPSRHHNPLLVACSRAMPRPVAVMFRDSPAHKCTSSGFRDLIQILKLRSVVHRKWLKDYCCIVATRETKCTICCRLKPSSTASAAVLAPRWRAGGYTILSRPIRQTHKILYPLQNAF